MANQLIVDLPELEIFGRRLAAVRQGLLDAPKRVDQSVADVGSGELRSALEYFEDNWKDGRHRMDQTLDALVQMAERIVTGLQDTDQKLRDAIDKSKQKSV
ncbi:hypothetical protein [Embleya sp. NBC_00896]|uniref:hypothetical protein n=1 Tax=Embleya sp. NBC_00896 TaxID=2975961 RepID=UPI002F90C5BF|nr:hypothetical protein OG928_40045 [Embleya sp. NBC_00896]